MRYLILIAVLLIPVWGWAEGKRIEPSGMGFMVCDESLTCRADKAMMQKHSTCYQRMREAITKMKEQMRPNPNSRSLMRGFTMTEDAWNQVFEPIYQDCVEGK